MSERTPPKSMSGAMGFEDYRAGRLETYSIDEVRAHCGLSNDQR